MRYTNLQAGRFVAAVAVLVFHLAYHAHEQLGLETALIEPVPAYWFRTSIIFFFALSGFVLAHGLQSARLRSFVAARFLRLYPAYWVVAATALVAREAAGRQLPFDNKGLWYAAILWPAGPNRSAYSIGVEWTLVYEVLLSLALVPFAALGRRKGLGIGAALWLAAIVGTLIATDGQVFRPFPRLAEFPLSVLNAAFLLGVLTYLLQEHLPRFGLLLPLSAVAAAGAGSQCASSAVGWSLALQSLGTVAAVGCAVRGPQLPARNPFVRAGDWSYGIYLVHVPAMTAFFALIASSSWPLAALPAAVLGGALALTVGCLYGAVEWGIYRRLRARYNKPTPAAATLPFPVPTVTVPRAA